MPKPFLIEGEMLIKPITNQLRDLSVRISEWHPDDIEAIQKDAEELRRLSTSVLSIAETLNFTFPPKDE